jgi:glucose/arabinose dehydrogenase
VLNITDTVWQSSESGLLGLALHPNFASAGGPDNWVYLVYTYSLGTPKRERLVRYWFDGVKLTAPQILIDNILASSTHDGSRLIFLQDGTLLMTTGDAAAGSNSQNFNGVNGKILRLNADGSIPADNPYPGSYLYVQGLRNSQGLVQAPWGTVYLSEHGPTTDDEFNMIEAGRNYGWPTVAGYCNLAGEMQFCADSNVVEPLYAWTPTIAPSDLVWYDYLDLPEFKDKMLMAVLKDKRIVALELNSTHDQVVSVESYFTNQLGRIRDLIPDVDGSLLIATNGEFWSNTSPNTHAILRIKPKAFLNIAETHTPKVKAWPNPFTNSLTIELPADGMVSLFSADGRMVWQQEYTRGRHFVNFNGSTGVYFLRYSTDILNEVITLYNLR